MKSILLLTLLLCFTASAENIDIYGMSLSVDSIETIDSKLVKLTLDGKSELISSRDIKIKVVEAAIKNGSIQDINLDRLRGILLKALNEEDLVVAGTILSSLITTDKIDLNKIDQSRLLQLLKELSSHRLSSALFTRILDQMIAAKEYKAPLLPNLIFLTYQKNPNFNVVYDKAILDPLSLKIKEIAKEELNLKILSEDKGDSVINTATRIFGKQDKTVEYLIRAQSFANIAITNFHELNISGLYDLLNGAGDDAYLVSMIDPYVTKTLHGKAEQLLSQSMPLEALSILSDVSENRRTPTTHDLVLKSLQDLNKEQSSKLSESVTAFLKILSTKDNSVASAYKEFLAGSFKRSIDNNDWAQATLTLSQIRELTTDNNFDKNFDNNFIDQLLLIAVKASGQAGMTEIRDEFLRQLSASPSFFTKLSFIYSGIYGNRFVIWITTIALGIFITFAALVLFVRANKLKALERAKLFNFPIEDEDSGQSGALSREEVTELRKHLLMLNLKPDATIRDIKVAFRRSVKELHPDNQKLNHDKNTAPFIELTQAYERLLELAEKASRTASS